MALGHWLKDYIGPHGGGSGGGENSPYIVDVLNGEKNGRNAQVLSKTFKDVYDAFMAGKTVLLSYPSEEDGFPAGSYEFRYVNSISYNGEDYNVYVGDEPYTAQDYNDFPYLIIV